MRFELCTHGVDPVGGDVADGGRVPRLHRVDEAETGMRRRARADRATEHPAATPTAKQSSVSAVDRRLSAAGTIAATPVKPSRTPATAPAAPPVSAPRLTRAVASALDATPATPCSGSSGSSGSEPAVPESSHNRIARDLSVAPTRHPQTSPLSASSRTVAISASSEAKAHPIVAWFERLMAEQYGLTAPRPFP